MRHTFVRVITNFMSPIIKILGALCIGTVMATAQAKTLTIQGADEATSGVIEVPESAGVNVEVNAEGIVLTLPIMDVRVRCLGEVNLDGYCYLSAASPQTGGVDSDGDGVPDDRDQCPSSGSSTFVNSNGCASQQLDDDGDGVPNGIDQCSNTPQGVSVDAVGCSSSQSDADGDGIANTQDQCPDTPSSENANAQGCSPSQLDSDNDGVNNAIDQCPNTPAGVTVDGVGCEVTTSNSTYCSGAPSNVTCSASVNFDTWWEGSATRNFKTTRNRIISIPFSTRESTRDGGYLQYATYESRLLDGWGFHAWFSASPGGSVLEGGVETQCNLWLAEARGAYYWTQDSQYKSSPGVCYIGQEKRTLYLNFEVCKGTTLTTCDASAGRLEGYSFDVQGSYRPL